MANRFTPIPSNANLQQALQLINRDLMALDAEATTKSYKQAGGNAVVIGKLKRMASLLAILAIASESCLGNTQKMGMLDYGSLKRGLMLWMN